LITHGVAGYDPRELEALKPRLAETYHVSEIGVFGSVARGEGTTDSDLDLLIEFDEPVSLFDLVRLEQ
jgi:predicted nucleotidyltransferase